MDPLSFTYNNGPRCTCNHASSNLHVPLHSADLTHPVYFYIKHQRHQGLHIYRNCSYCWSLSLFVSFHSPPPPKGNHCKGGIAQHTVNTTVNQTGKNNIYNVLPFHGEGEPQIGIRPPKTRPEFDIIPITKFFFKSLAYGHQSFFEGREDKN